MSEARLYKSYSEKWQARAEAAEARCARLTELLREMTGWSDKQIEEGIASDFGALSDTAQQETGDE